MTIGPPGKHLGKSRWPLTTVIATGGGIYSATGGLWTQAALFWAATVVLAAMTVWSYRR